MTRASLPEDFVARRRVLRAIGAALAARWARGHDQAALVDDLEHEGWLVVLRLGADHPRVRWEVANADRNFLARLLYGVGRGHSRERGRVALLPLDDMAFASPEMNPLRWTLFREVVAQRLARRAPSCRDRCGARVKRLGTRCRHCKGRAQYSQSSTNLLRGRRRTPVLRSDPATTQSIDAAEQGCVSEITLILRERRKAYHEAMRTALQQEGLR